MKVLSIIGIIISAFGLLISIKIADPEPTRVPGIILVIFFIYFLALSIVGVNTKPKNQ